jgi:ribonuclease HI
MISSPPLEIFTDGGSRGNPGPGASAFIVFKDKNEVFRQAFFFNKTTNNIAEYFAVLMAVLWLSKNIDIVGINAVVFKIDSELIVNQLKGIYKIKNEKLKNIYNKINNLTNSTGINISYTHIPRNLNKIADSLVNEKMDENL